MNGSEKPLNHRLPLRDWLVVTVESGRIDTMAKAYLDADGADPSELHTRMEELLREMGRHAVALTRRGQGAVAAGHQFEWLSLLVPRPWELHETPFDRVPSPDLVRRLGEEVAQLLYPGGVRIKTRKHLRKHGFLVGVVDSHSAALLLARVVPLTINQLEWYLPLANRQPLSGTRESGLVRVARNDEDPALQHSPVIAYSEVGQGAEGVVIKCGFHEPYRQLDDEDWAVSDSSTGRNAWQRPAAWSNGPVTWLLPPWWSVGEHDNPDARAIRLVLDAHVARYLA